MAPKEPCAKYQYVLTSAGPKILPVADEESKDEESPADYNAGGYLPVKVDDVFKDGRYRVLRKLGWGHFSTVWLVKDNHANRHSALKVVKSAGRYAETARDEIKLLSKVSEASFSHPGRDHIVSFLDSFLHAGREASHICIVFEPLGENLLALIERHKKKGVPRALVKVISRQMLLGLAYLHDECDLVHTDIKPENILISIPDIESHIQAELSRSPSPTSRHVGVPLPARPGVVSIPAARTSRRQVHIFDSQPLASPGRGSSSGSKTASSFGVGGTMKHNSRIASSGGQSVKSPLSPKPAPPQKSATAVGTTSPRSTASSMSSSMFSLTETVVASTPATSVSHGSIFSRMQPLEKVNAVESPEQHVLVPTSDVRSEISTAIISPGKMNIGGKSAAIDLGLPSSSWKDSAGVNASSSWRGSPHPASRKFNILSSPASRNDPAARLVGGTATPAPAVVVSASVSISCAGVDVVVSEGTNSAGGEDGCIQLDSNGGSKASANGLASLLTQTAPRVGTHVARSSAPPSNDSSRTLQYSASLLTAGYPPSPPSPPSPSPSPPPLPAISIKIADLGNATPSRKHFTEDIQTRQYRSPEAILGRRDWDARVDVWSLACVTFELLAGEYLFDPHGQGELFTKDDDHMAQIIELMGDFSLEAKMGGKYSRELFDHSGALRYIRGLKPWPLKRVMTEKYLFSEDDAVALCAFLEPMLAVDMRERKKASDMVDHSWLTVSEEEEEVGEW